MLRWGSVRFAKQARNQESRMTVVRADSGSSQGPAVDRAGAPVIDPTENVTALVKAGLERQDELRKQESVHIHELLDLRAAYDAQLRVAESRRIDAIRAVDVAAVAQAAQVSATQATILATQVSASAETLRTTVAASALSSANALSAALGPMQTSIDALRQAQYQQQGQAAQKTEGRGDGQWLTTTIIAIAAAVASYVFTHTH